MCRRAAEGANLPVMMLAMSNGASPDWNNPDERGKTSLMAAASVVVIFVAVVDFLYHIYSHFREVSKPVSFSFSMEEKSTVATSMDALLYTMQRFTTTLESRVSC